MKLELSLPKNSFVLGEDIDVDVRLRNTGSEAVQLPLPSSPSNGELTYTLGGPAYPEPRTFSYRSVRLRGRPAPPAPPDVETLEPGGLFEHGFELGQWITVTEPGSYTIEARLRWRDIDVSSERLTFVLEGNTFRSAAFGVDVGTGSSRAVRLAWLGSSKQGPILGDALVQEKRPDLGKALVQGIASLRPVGTDASDPMMPWTNRDRSETYVSWVAWIEGRQLMAWRRTEAPVETFDLAERHVIRPVLQTPGGELKAVMLSADSTQVALVKFDPQPSLVSEATLPFPVREGCALLGPEPESRTHVILVGQQGSAVVMLHWMADSGPGGELRTIKIPNAELAGIAQPALRVDEKGRTHAAVVVVREQGARAGILRAIFPAPAESAVDAKVTPLPTVPRNIRRSAAAFDVSRAAVSDPLWLVELESRELIHSGNPDVRQRVAPDVAQPLQFLRMSQASYVLALDPSKGPALVNLQ